MSAPVSSATVMSGQQAADRRPSGEHASFSDDQWRELLAEDNFALGSVSMLLMCIVGVGMFGMLIVVAIMTLS